MSCHFIGFGEKTLLTIKPLKKTKSEPCGGDCSVCGGRVSGKHRMEFVFVNTTILTLVLCSHVVTGPGDVGAFCVEQTEPAAASEVTVVKL